MCARLPGDTALPAFRMAASGALITRRETRLIEH